MVARIALLAKRSFLQNAKSANLSARELATGFITKSGIPNICVSMEAATGDEQAKQKWLMQAINARNAARLQQRCIIFNRFKLQKDGNFDWSGQT